MESPDSSSRSRIGFWLAVALLALIAAEKVVMVDAIDPDAFWHLRVADQISRDGVRPIVDDLSYMSQREPWTPYSWLAELGMRQIVNRCGLMRGAVMTHLIVAMTLVLISALACRDASDRGREIPVLIGVLLAGMWTQWFVAFRPVSMAFVVLSISAWLLLRDRQMDERSRAVWIIPILVGLCINLHFFAMMMLAWIGALVAGAIIERDRRGVKRYALLLIASAIGLLATPMLPGMLRSIQRFAAADPVVASGTIVEMTYVWRQGWGVVLSILATATFVWLIVKRRQVRVGEWIWLIAMSVLAARYARFMPLFGIIAAPLLARTLPPIGARVLTLRPVWAMVGVVIIVTTYRVIAGVPVEHSLSTHYPVQAAEFVARSIEPRTRHLINGFNYGGYLAWRLPQFKVMADARTQLYPPEFWRKFFFSDAERTKAALQELIATKGADAAVLPRDDQHFQPLLLEFGWTIAQQDERAVVLIPAPLNSDRN